MLNCNVYCTNTYKFWKAFLYLSCTKPGCLLTCLTKYSWLFFIVCWFPIALSWLFCSEPEFVNVYGAQESIWRKRFHQLCTLAGRYKNNYCAGPPGIDSLVSWNRFLGSWNKFCHEMNNFLKVLKIKSVLSVYASFAALLWRN